MTTGQIKSMAEAGFYLTFKPGRKLAYSVRFKTRDAAERRLRELGQQDRWHVVEVPDPDPETAA